MRGVRTLVEVFISFGLFCYTNARKIDSQDLLIGEWDARIRCPESSFATELFPPRRTVSAKTVQRKQRKWERPRSFHCRLLLYPNGTFGLEPTGSGWMAANEKSQILAVRGRWTLDRNPYCVTDRFYDQVVLKSYPRVQKKVVDGREEVLQTVKMQIQCRLSGHFSPGRLPFFRNRKHPCYARGKLSHAVLVLDRQMAKEDYHMKRRRPKVGASFAARRQIPSMKALERYWEAEETGCGTNDRLPNRKIVSQTPCKQ